MIAASQYERYSNINFAIDVKMQILVTGDYC